MVKQTWLQSKGIMLHRPQKKVELESLEGREELMRNSRVEPKY